MQVAFFWVVTPCSDVVKYQRFGALCCFHLHPPKRRCLTTSLHGITTQKIMTALKLHGRENLKFHKHEWPLSSETYPEKQALRRGQMKYTDELTAGCRVHSRPFIQDSSHTSDQHFNNNDGDRTVHFQNRNSSKLRQLQVCLKQTGFIFKLFGYLLPQLII
jgi:hypothetical protein